MAEGLAILKVNTVRRKEDFRMFEVEYIKIEIKLKKIAPKKQSN